MFCTVVRLVSHDRDSQCWYYSFPRKNHQLGQQVGEREGSEEVKWGSEHCAVSVARLLVALVLFCSFSNLKGNNAYVGGLDLSTPSPATETFVPDCVSFGNQCKLMAVVAV